LRAFKPKTVFWIPNLGFRRPNRECRLHVINKLKYDVTVYDVPMVTMFQWLWCSSHNVTIYEVRCSLIRCYRPPPFIQILKYFQHKYYYLILYWSNLLCLNGKDVVEKGFLWNARYTKRIICFYLNISCQLLNNYEFSHFHKKMFACN